MSRSSTKVQVMSAKPSKDQTLISSMPLTEEMASSSGKTTPVTTSSGVAPGRRTSTFTVAVAAFGKRYTARPRGENKPHATREGKSLHPKKGKLLHSFTHLLLYYVPTPKNRP